MNKTRIFFTIFFFGQLKNGQIFVHSSVETPLETYLWLPARRTVVETDRLPTIPRSSEGHATERQTVCVCVLVSGSFYSNTSFFHKYKNDHCEINFIMGGVTSNFDQISVSAAFALGP